MCYKNRTFLFVTNSVILGRSGRSGVFQLLSPLRTVRDSFPSHGSSILKIDPVERSGRYLPIQPMPDVHGLTWLIKACFPYGAYAANNN